MALYIPRSIFQLARLLYVRAETFGPTLVRTGRCYGCKAAGALGLSLNSI